MPTSGKIHGVNAELFLGGYRVSSDVMSVEIDSATATAKSTGLGGSTDDTFVIGVRDNKVTVKGFFDDDAAAGLYTAVTGLSRTLFTATFCPAGDTQGYAALMGNTQIPTDLKVGVNTTGAASLDSNFQISGILDAGVVLLPHTIEAGTGSAAPQTSLDQTASSANGASAHFHILAIDAACTVSAFKVQHSSDNITFPDLMTSGLAGTAQGSDRQVAAGTINRYVRVTFTITNGKNATLAVAFHRE